MLQKVKMILTEDCDIYTVDPPRYLKLSQRSLDLALRKDEKYDVQQVWYSTRDSFSR